MEMFRSFPKKNVILPDFVCHVAIKIFVINALRFAVPSTDSTTWQYSKQNGVFKNVAGFFDSRFIFAHYGVIIVWNGN